MKWYLWGIGISAIVDGTLDDAIARAIELDERYQRAYGVTVTDARERVYATVDDGKIELEEV